MLTAMPSATTRLHSMAIGLRPSAPKKRRIQAGRKGIQNPHEVDSCPFNILLPKRIEILVFRLEKAGSRYQVKKMDVFTEEPIIHRCSWAMNTSKIYFTSTRNDAQGDELSGITGARLATSSILKKTTRENGADRKPSPLV